MRVRDRLFDVSPYKGFDPSPYPADVQGWGSDHPVLIEAVQVLRPARIVEVGTWKGRSAINMARAAKQVGLDTEVVCVDTWLGSPEHWDKDGYRQYYDWLYLRHGQPQLYFVFLANVVRSGMAEIITPFPTTSDNAATTFRRLGVRFDLAYIDAAHEYGPARRDFETYYELLNEGGLLIADDYRVGADVTRAADDFAAEHKLLFAAGPGKFVVAKSNLPPGVTLIERWLSQAKQAAAA